MDSLYLTYVAYAYLGMFCQDSLLQVSSTMNPGKTCADRHRQVFSCVLNESQHQTYKLMN